MREKEIESYLREQVKVRDGKAYKFTSPGNAGVPDRLVLLPGGRAVFVELKAPGKTSTALQQVQQRRIRELGFPVYEADSREKVDQILSSL